MFPCALKRFAKRNARCEQFCKREKENARNASNRQREMRARDAREQRKDNEEFTGKERKFQREMLGWDGGKRCSTVTRQIAFVNRKTMAPAGGESEGKGKRGSREKTKEMHFRERSGKRKALETQRRGGE